MPAYNEEENIVPTLASLCNNKTSRSVEIIVVNNNSKDNTEALVKACGVNCVLETTQGINSARNAGLAQAKDEVILIPHADTIDEKVWTNDRRIQIDGVIWKAIGKRLKRVLNIKK